MKRLSLYCSGWPLALLCMATTAAALAQPVYRSVGPDGRVVFSDRPMATTQEPATAGGRPSPTGENAARRADPTAATATATSSPTHALHGLPFELRQVASRYPVTLYTSTPCAPCDAGRTALRQRGVPFIERQVKTPDDVEALTQLSGDAGMPFLTIGGKPVKGFSEGEWQGYLDAAGYPQASRLPTNYRWPDPTPLTTLKAAPLATATPPSGETPAQLQQPSASDAATPRRSRSAAAPSPSAPSSSNPSGIKF